MGRKFCRSETDLNANKGADAVVDCPGSFTTETRDELMKYVELHAKEGPILVSSA
jgi:hypothetical protein